jgi:hypothetical protein
VSAIGRPRSISSSVGDRDGPEALGFRVVEEVGHRDGAVVGVVGVHVQVGEDERAVRQRLGRRANQLPPPAQH